MAQAKHYLTTSRRSLFTGAIAATLAGAVPAVAGQAGGDDSRLVKLCAEFVSLQLRFDAIEYEIADDGELERQSVEFCHALADSSRRILAERATAPGDIVALARALSIHAGHGWHDMDPSDETITGRINKALMRESLRLSGLPIYPELLA